MPSLWGDQGPGHETPREWTYSICYALAYAGADNLVLLVVRGRVLGLIEHLGEEGLERLEVKWSGRAGGHGGKARGRRERERRKGKLNSGAEERRIAECS